LITLPLPGQDNVGSSSNTQLVDGIAPVPDTARTLDYGNEFLSNALTKAALSAACVPPL
jgi:hypothetical protein